MKRQLAFLLARAQIPIEWLQPPSTDDNADGDVDVEFQEELPEDLLECLSNSRLSSHFREFGKELGVADAKSLEDVYKSHLENASKFCTYFFVKFHSYLACVGPGTSANVDSARGNLAGTFVNAFVNAGFGNDKLMVEAEEGNSWIYKNKDHGLFSLFFPFMMLIQLAGMMSAAASLGLSLLWDTDVGLSHVDKYTYSAEEHIKANQLYSCSKTQFTYPWRSPGWRPLRNRYPEHWGPHGGGCCPCAVG
jgi:26S proteasome regulatory subunit N1